MNAHSLIVFGAHGYVGGTIAAVARMDGQRVTEIGSHEFSFWGDTIAWPVELLEASNDTAILAASFEKSVVRDDESLTPVFLEKFAALLDSLHARRVIFLSSDAVFNGLRGQYLESDSPSPITSYGRCKAAMEGIAVKQANVHIVRMSVVWGHGATKPDARRRRYLRKGEERYAGAANAFRSPIEVTRLAGAIVRMTHEETLPKILHLATPRMSYLDFLRSCLLPEVADRIDCWTDPMGYHDTSLSTEHPEFVDRLLR